MSEEKKLKLENPEIFINRIAEKQYFLDYFNSVPRNILFVYWPINSWKTKLISNILDELKSKDNFIINLFDFRTFIPNFQYFKEYFLDMDESIKLDPITYTLLKLKESNKNGRKHILFLDHLHDIPNFYIDENKTIKFEDFLLNLIRIILKNNLSHIICSTTYDFEKFYNNSKYNFISDFYLMEHLSKKDIYFWLEEKEKCPEKMIKDIWKNLWWSVWEIWQVLVSYKNTWYYKEELDDLLQVKYSLIKEWYNFLEEWLFNLDLNEKEKNKIKQKIEIFLNIIEKIVKKWEFIRWKDWIAHFELIKELVDKDLWFYDTKQRKITANSKSLEIAFKRLLKELK